MKINLKKDWILWILILSPLLIILWKWNELPDKIPMHWNASGEIDNYGGKMSVFFGPCLNLGIYLLLLFIPRLDPRKKNYALFEGAYWWIRLFVTLLITVVCFVTVFAALNTKINSVLIIEVSVFALFILMGNQFGKIRPNYFVGIRTPWTLDNEEVWMKTHRLAGMIWVIASLIMLPVILLVPQNLVAILFISYVCVIAGIPVIYSWWLHRKITGSTPPKAG